MPLGLRIALVIAESQSGGRADSPWPLQTLLDAGVPFPVLLDAYESVIENEELQAGGSGTDAKTRCVSTTGQGQTEEAAVHSMMNDNRGIDALFVIGWFGSARFARSFVCFQIVFLTIHRSCASLFFLTGFGMPRAL